MRPTKIVFPHTLKFGDCRSTKTFHVEHFSSMSQADIAFGQLSTKLNNFIPTNPHK
jgi:hypothetical protein